MANDRSRPAGIKEIAQALGISIGTVDRALHGRGGVSADTLAKVLKMAERLQYRPNLAARNLKLNRRIRIAVHLPREIAWYFDAMRDGVRAAEAAMLSVKLDLDFRTFPRLGEGELELMERDLKRGYDGVVLTPGNPLLLEPIIRRFILSGTAVVCVGSDAPRSGRLSAVSVDAAVSGGLAGELLGRVIHSECPVATITGDLSTYDHSEKLRGFAGTLAAIAPHLSLLPAIETHERPKDAYRATLELLRRKTKPAGLYVSTANSISVIKAIEELDMLGRLSVITTDLFPEIAARLGSGQILATIYQRPFTQGKMALEALLQYLIEGTQPDSNIWLAPHIILRSNPPLFLARMRSSETDANRGDRRPGVNI